MMTARPAEEDSTFHLFTFHLIAFFLLYRVSRALEMNLASKYGQRKLTKVSLFTPEDEERRKKEQEEAAKTRKETERLQKRKRITSRREDQPKIEENEQGTSEQYGSDEVCYIHIPSLHSYSLVLFTLSTLV